MSNGDAELFASFSAHPRAFDPGYLVLLKRTLAISSRAFGEAEGCHWRYRQ